MSLVIPLIVPGQYRARGIYLLFIIVLFRQDLPETSSS